MTIARTVLSSMIIMHHGVKTCAQWKNTINRSIFHIFTFFSPYLFYEKKSFLKIKILFSDKSNGIQKKVIEKVLIKD